MNDQAVYRTAPATPGLLKSAHMPKIGWNLKTKMFFETIEQKECNDKW